MKPTASISLVRHGQVHNPRDLFYGRLPKFRLNSTGWDEACAAARFFENQSITSLYSSPLLRAVQTAKRILISHPLLKLRRSRLLLEVHTPWDGKPAAEVDLLGGDVYSGSGLRFEQPQDVVERARRFFRRTRRDYPGGHIVAITHGDVIALTVLWAQGVEVSARNKAVLHPFGISDGYPATGSITTFFFSDDSIGLRPQIRYVRPAPP